MTINMEPPDDEVLEEFWEDEYDYSVEEFYAEAEMARWDDDPSPYDGTYSEE